VLTSHTTRSFGEPSWLLKKARAATTGDYPNDRPRAFFSNPFVRKSDRLLIWNDLSMYPNASAILLCGGERGAERATVEAAKSTVDHSDIRGWSRKTLQHNRDPSGAASD